MLTEPERILIARGLDGLPDRAERKQLRVLLRSSAEARQLYRALARERQELARLPRHEAPSGVYASVMARVESCSPFASIPSTIRPVRQVRRPLLHSAIAASIVFAMVSSAFWLKQMAEQRSVVRNQSQSLPRVDAAATWLPDESPVVVSRIPADIEPLELLLTPLPPEVAPRPRTVKDKPRVVLGAPPTPVLTPEMLKVRLPMILSMKDLSNKETRKKIADELVRGPTARVDLFCNDSLKAADLIVATGRAVGVNVVLESTAKLRLRQKLPTAWLVYTDSLTPDEATKWLARLAASSDSIFQSMHFPSSTDQDSRDLRELLGIDLVPSPKPGPNGPKAAGTTAADPSRSASAKEKPAMMLSFLPPQARVNPATSPNLKTWVDRRKDPRTGTIRLMLVVR